MTTFIGIDGGGTKTTAIAADENGNIFGQVEVGPSNPNGYSMKRIEKTFLAIREKMNAFVTNWKDCVIFAGIAGTAHILKHKQILACLQKVFSDVRELHLDHDGMNALASVTYGDPGVIQIAGTGSLTFGLGENGKRCRIGGWGFLLGDEGSGFDLGRRALAQVMKAYDGTGPKTELTKLAMKKWELNSPADLIPHVYGNKMKETVASFTYELFQAVTQQDDVACAIIEQAAKDVVDAIQVAFDKLDLADKETDALIGLIGGAFQPALIDALRREIARRIPSPVKLIRPDVEPVIGSLVWAYKLVDLDPKNLLKVNH